MKSSGHLSQVSPTKSRILRPDRQDGKSWSDSQGQSEAQAKKPPYLGYPNKVPCDACFTRVQDLGHPNPPTLKNGKPRRGKTTARNPGRSTGPACFTMFPKEILAFVRPPEARMIYGGGCPNRFGIPFWGR